MKPLVLGPGSHLIKVRYKGTRRWLYLTPNRNMAASRIEAATGTAEDMREYLPLLRAGNGDLEFKVTKIW
jgi:hypothetical protein